MRIALLASLITCLLGLKLQAGKGLVTFRIVSSSGDRAVLEPVLPAQLSVVRIKGESQLTSIVQCSTIPSVKEAERRVIILRCGGTDYEVGDVLLQR